MREGAKFGNVVCLSLVHLLLLGVPDIPRGIGEAPKIAVSTLLGEWDIYEEVVGQVFDTTSSTTGKGSN